MTFTIVWDPDAEAELANIWVNSPDRSAVTLAAYDLEQRLRRNPDQVGESRPNDRRVAFEPPLGLMFRVLDADRIVRVLNVWAFR